MSKKIAQLTKVIFQLHSKNEENNQAQQAIGSCHEKEMEIVLKQANDVILKQKNEIMKLKEGADLKQKIKELEKEHIKERKDSQKEYELYQQQATEREAKLEKQYKEKAQDMKMDLQDMKKKFDERCEDFKRQLQNFKNNNEAIEALKKAHAKELAAHVQEHNRKYNELLQQKMDSEDALKEQAEKERKKLIAEAEQRLRTTVEETKKIE